MKRELKASSKQQNPIARCNPLHIFPFSNIPTLWRAKKGFAQSKQRQEDLIFWPDLKLNRCYWINLCDAWRSLFLFLPQPASKVEEWADFASKIEDFTENLHHWLKWKWKFLVEDLIRIGWVDVARRKWTKDKGQRVKCDFKGEMRL